MKARYQAFLEHYEQLVEDERTWNDIKKDPLAGLAKGAGRFVTGKAKQAATSVIDKHKDKQASKKAAKQYKSDLKSGTAEYKAAAADPEQAFKLFQKLFDVLAQVVKLGASKHPGTVINKRAKKYLSFVDQVVKTAPRNQLHRLRPDELTKVLGTLRNIADTLAGQARNPRTSAIADEALELIRNHQGLIKTLPEAIVTLQQRDKRYKYSFDNEQQGEHSASPQPPQGGAAKATPQKAKQLRQLITQDPNAEDTIEQILIALQRTNPRAFDIIQQHYSP